MACTSAMRPGVVRCSRSRARVVSHRTWCAGTMAMRRCSCRALVCALTPPARRLRENPASTASVNGCPRRRGRAGDSWESVTHDAGSRKHPRPVRPVRPVRPATPRPSPAAHSTAHCRWAAWTTSNKSEASTNTRSQPETAGHPPCAGYEPHRTPRVSQFCGARRRPRPLCPRIFAARMGPTPRRWVVQDPSGCACECREPGHGKRPAHSRTRARRADHAAGAARLGCADAAIGEAGGRCSAGCVPAARRRGGAAW
jgi:hypothetical protein